MKTFNSILKRILAVLVLLGLVLGVYLLWARPAQLQWGATAEEIARPMPGDELDPAPTFLANRAITINGTPAEIWPWLLQMGYGRAGYYGFDIMENPGGIASAGSILPEFQHFAVGDPVPISPAAQEVFYAIEPERYLIWAGESAAPTTAVQPGDLPPGGFTWALYPVDSGHTRLVSRIRWTHHSITQPVLFSLDLFTELTDHLAVRKILLGVKGRVEGYQEAPLVTDAEFGLYLLSALIFTAAIFLLLIRAFTWRRWLVGLAAGAGWLLTWYAPLPLWSRALVELLILIGMGMALFRKSRAKFSTPTGKVV